MKPGTILRRAKRTPLAIARALRQVFEDQIPKTIDDGIGLNAYNFAKMIQEQTGCTFREAMGPTQEVCPELFADYWAEQFRKADPC